MPPKTKKNKQEDAEALRLQQELERKAMEERLLQEQLAKEKQLRDAIEAVVKSELPRLESGQAELENFRLSMIQQWMQIDRQMQEKQDWEKFVQCNQKPDPRFEKSINNFMSIWKDTFQPEYRKLNGWIEKLSEIESVCASLEGRALGVDEVNKTSYNVPDMMRNLRLIILSTWDVMTTLILTHNDSFPQEQEENQVIPVQGPGNLCGLWNNSTKNPRFKKIEFPQVNMQSSIPRPISQANVSLRLLLTTQPSIKYLYFDKERNQYPEILGGVLQLNLYEMPVIPKRFRGWAVRPHYPTNNIPRLSYPLATSAVDMAVDEDELAQQTWPFSIEFSLPNECSPPPKECFEARLWNPARSTWVTEGIDSYDYDIDSRSVRVKTQNDGVVALIQKPFYQYPLKQWSLAREGENSVKISLEGTNLRIEVLVENGTCRLIAADPPVPEKVMEQRYDPATFFQRLSFYGRDFMGPKEPVPNGPGKIALSFANMVAVVEFRKNEKNSNLPPNQLVFDYFVANGDSTAPEWKSIMANTDFIVGSLTVPLAYKLNKSETIKDLEPDIDTIRNAHSNPFYALQASLPENQLREQQLPSQLLRTVYETLLIVRPCS